MGQDGGVGDDLQPGLYDQLLNVKKHQELNELDERRLRAKIRRAPAAELPDRAAEVVASWVRDSLNATGSEDRPEAALRVTEAVLGALADSGSPLVPDEEQLADPIELLAAIERLSPAGDSVSLGRPLTPLRDTVLMTNGRDQPSLSAEISAEIESADRIDLVLAFIRWTGIRNLLGPLRRHVEAGKELRIITTTYTGSTELRALEALADLGAQVKVSYDTTTTRLHAKAWMFERATGFSTVYIGSSNLTFSAQVSGLEWNVRASQRLNPDVVASFGRTFASYWADAHFEDFDSARFRQATQQTVGDEAIATPFEIEPYPFQRQILERLEVRRERGHPHNLVAAATGTGKTVIAAMDYRILQARLSRSRLLFVAHRSEILEQSQAVFRHVLRDGAFGELWVGGNRPTQWDHVFASVQSINANDVESIEQGQFDVVIIDEFHHAAASSYEALLNHLKPKHLLGLTATPERADGLDVLRWFGGEVAVELRLWDALEQGLLSPFHYFGIHDSSDLSGVKWRRGRGYDSGELTNLYTGDDLWVSKVLQSVNEKVGDPKSMKALGFCVSINHAEFMASRFNRAGIRSKSLTSQTAGAERRQALSDLRSGQLQVLFTVDLFNEGVDIPSADVVLMLRPTESATVFLQQLGRGLRRSEGKDVLTVLDFVGNQNKEFRFDLRYRSMLGRTRSELEADIVQDFPFLPAGCEMTLDPVARDIVLQNVRSALPTSWRDRIRELKEMGPTSLRTFVEETGLELEDIYRGNRTWTELRRAAGFIEGDAVESESRVGRGIARLLHVDDQERIDTYANLLSSSTAPKSAHLDQRQQRQLEGLLLTLLTPKKATYANLDEASHDLWRHEHLRHEALEVLPLLESQIGHLHPPLQLLHPVPLSVHARYTREEILGAFGASTVTSPLPLQTGVFWHQDTSCFLLFITLEKSEKDYSPTTRYLDYAISDKLFHWESQSRNTADSERGKNYIHHQDRGLSVALFIRRTKKDRNGRTSPYLCAGTARYVEHRSEKPLQITWELDERLPGDVFASYRAAIA